LEIVIQGLVIARLKEGETFGEMELLDIMPSIVPRVRAATPLRSRHYFNRALYEISKLDLKNLFHDDHEPGSRSFAPPTPLDELACSGFERYPKKK